MEGRMWMRVSWISLVIRWFPARYSSHMNWANLMSSSRPSTSLPCMLPTYLNSGSTGGGSGEVEGGHEELLTCFVDARVIAQLQHVEVAPLHAAPDAVDARDVGAFALHREQRSHHVLVAVMLEVRPAHREPHQPQQEGSDPGESPAALHGPSAQVEEERRRGGEEVWRGEEAPFLGKRGCFHGTALPNPCSPQSSIH
ncbi:hypothetical protein EYF80_061206 [Liparis tanakae]|uniref:Uncharacterized protein n=1 Tax=Liparis tanakae TaxID=230148 RepID=A0A4Z2EIG4_9TELE|nr:hypothetical protein EYF80_061206 [Liparis tanakae]